MSLILYIKIEQQKYLGNYPSVDCSEHENINKQDVFKIFFKETLIFLNL